jgi:gamma-glutamyltranspeptidase/glutathione hydrolase
MTITATELLSPERLTKMADWISLDRAASITERMSPSGGTVYLTAADASGMMVSFIQSNFWDFGSGVVVKDSGISLQSRGLGFSLDASHPNCVQGGRRPFHTIIPGFVTMAGAPVMSFGVMGAHMQPQGHVQVMVRMFDQGLNPQAACDAPRWCLTPDFELALEPGFSAQTIQGLEDRGHKVLLEEPMSVFGGAQLVHRLEHGFCAASDPRKDGQAVGF